MADSLDRGGRRRSSRTDKIIVLHKDQVREMGSHQQLLARRKIYYKLYQLQYRDQEMPGGVPPVPANADD